MNAISFPLGDQTGSVSSARLSSMSTDVLPVARSTTMIRHVLAQSEKTIFLPSGEMSGNVAFDLRSVSRCRPLPSARIVQIS